MDGVTTSSSLSNENSSIWNGPRTKGHDGEITVCQLASVLPGLCSQLNQASVGIFMRIRVVFPRMKAPFRVIDSSVYLSLSPHEDVWEVRDLFTQVRCFNGAHTVTMWRMELMEEIVNKLEEKQSYGQDFPNSDESSVFLQSMSFRSFYVEVWVNVRGFVMARREQKYPSLSFPRADKHSADGLFTSLEQRNATGHSQLRQLATGINYCRYGGIGTKDMINWTFWAVLKDQRWYVWLCIFLVSLLDLRSHRLLSFLISNKHFWQTAFCYFVDFHWHFSVW